MMLSKPIFKNSRDYEMTLIMGLTVFINEVMHK